MDRRHFIKSVFSTAVLAFLAEDLYANKPKRMPLNFVFLLADDLGWADIGCYGSTFYETPNIDKLAAQGMRFTDAYADSPVCSPTRASIMTGKCSTRLNLTNFDGLRGPLKKLIPPQPTSDMPLEEFTIAEAMKEGGYKTFFAGKWHLSHDPKIYPQHQGFDINIAGHAAGQPGSYYYPYKHPIHTWSNVPDLEDGKPGEYLTNRLTDETLKFLDTVGYEPFFVYHAFYSVHTPIEPRKDLAETYESKLKERPGSEKVPYVILNGQKVKQIQDNPDYAAMIAAVDESVGRILSKIHQLGKEENTVVIFMSDNGGLFKVTSNLPLRAGKAWLYEGGIREPMIIKWPGTVKPGSVCHEPVISTDFYPTMLKMAGLPLRPQQHLDGISLVSLLKGKEHLDRKAIFWHYPHYHSLGNTPAGAVRSGDYKLIENYEDFSVELYKLKQDIGEQNNLAEAMPGKVDELRNLLHAWRKEVDAQMPVKNPDWVIYELGKPELPNILIVGDSISIGYTPYVKELLSDKANVYRIPTNAQDTHSGLKNLERWLGDMKWDVIHFNWGLHDLCYRNPRSTTQGHLDKIHGMLTTSLDEYEKNLSRLVQQLKKTGAILIWANTTPVPDKEAGRIRGDEVRYNAVADKVMPHNGVHIEDLYTYALKRIDEIQLPGGNVHYTPEGYQCLAGKVEKTTLEALNKFQ